MRKAHNLLRRSCYPDVVAGRAARKLLKIMLQAVRDHKEQLRKKKEDALSSNVVAAPDSRKGTSIAYEM